MFPLTAAAFGCDEDPRQREQEAGKLAVREHGKGDLGAKPRNEVLAGLLDKIKGREA